MSSARGGFVNWRQADVLAERYLAVMLGNLGGTALLLSQVPIIGGLICLSWMNAAPDAKLGFCVCLSAVWLGCMNACREIVKERPLYERERMVNLEIPAYVISKLEIQSGFSALQCAALLGMVVYWVGLPGNKLFLFAALWLGSLAGTMLGLCISASVSTTDQAVTLVPIAIIPQIIFTKLVMPEGGSGAAVAWLERLNPLKWTLDLYQRIGDFSREATWGECFKDVAVLAAFAAALFAGAMAVLWLQED